MSCVIVLGCYRSGTSAVAGVLHHLGVMMGKEFDKPAHSNPKGYFEDVEFKAIYSKLIEGKDVVGNLDVMVRLREAEYDLWGVKDPQLCIVLSKFVPLIKKGHKIISTLRPKEEICDSLHRAMPEELRQTPERFLPLVDYYLSRKDANLAVYDGPILEVDFAKLKADKKAQIERIAEFVGVPVTKAALEFVDQ